MTGSRRIADNEQRDPSGSAPKSGGLQTAQETSGISLGTLLGISIRADVSLLFIIGLIAFNLGASVFPAWHPNWPLGLRWGVAIGAALLFFVSILLHELSHALVGRAVGASVNRITLFMFGGMAHVEREPKRPAAELWMAIVGPVTSLVIGIFALVLGNVLGATAFAGSSTDELMAPMRHLGPLSTLLLWLGPVNVLLALFNLIPGFPLDGGRVLRALLWWITGSFLRATRWASRVGQFFSWLLIAVGLSMLLGAAVPVLGGGVFQGVWLILIGWFLNNAARASYQQALVDDAVKDMSVRALMDTHVQAVPPNLSIGSLVHERLLHSEQRCFPVAENGSLEGLVCLDDIRRVARADWDDTPISSVMTPAERLTALSPEDQAERAIELLATKDVDQIPVVDGKVLRGLVRRRDVLRWVGLYHGTGQ